MNKVSTDIRQFRECDGDPITLDRELLEELVQDAQEHQGLLTVGPLWSMDRFFTKERRSSPAFDDMLSLWVGKKTLVEIDQEALDRYIPFLQEHDHLELLPHFLNQSRNGYIKRISDLGTIADINLIYRYLPHARGVMRVLEIGGGYGRLAEGMMGVFGQQVKYTLVDAVPLSLVYACQYMSKAFPDREVRLTRRPRDFTGDDCIVVPSWHFERENDQQYDIGVCVASMQEMEQEQVDYYIGLLDRVVKTGGLIYLCNSRDYFRREFSYPPTWRLVHKGRVPRSISPDFPAEVFRKTLRDCRVDNRGLEEEYIKGLCEEYREAYWHKFDHTVRLIKKVEKLEAELEKGALGIVWRLRRRIGGVVRKDGE